MQESMQATGYSIGMSPANLECAKNIIGENKGKMDRLVSTLMEKQHLTGQ